MYADPDGADAFEGSIVAFMDTGTPDGVLHAVSDLMTSEGLNVEIAIVAGRTVVGGIGLLPVDLERRVSGINRVVHVVVSTNQPSFWSRRFREEDTSFAIGDLTLGSGLLLAGGPEAIENEEMILMSARVGKAAGINLFLSRAYVTSGSPYRFRGLGEEGLRLLAAAGREVGLPVGTEVITVDDVRSVNDYVDAFMVSGYSMHDHQLLEEVAHIGKPVIITRAANASVSEWLEAAEYVLVQGNDNIVLCEAGIATFESMTRRTLDLSSVALVRRLSHLPVMVDAGASTGHWYLVESAAMASIAAGAQGLLLLFHPNPDNALTEGGRGTLTFESLRRAIVKVQVMRSALLTL